MPKGIYPPIPTPFQNGEVAYDKPASNLQKWNIGGICLTPLQFSKTHTFHIFMRKWQPKRYPNMHGAPVGIRDPKGLGIKDFCHPEFAVGTKPVTPQSVAVEAKIPFMITHSPGYMFVTDKLVEDFAVK